MGPMHTCGLCQRYHGEVLCALGWACWKRTSAGTISSQHGDEPACTRFRRCKILQVRVVREKGRAVQDAAPWHQKKILGIMANIGGTYENLGQLKKGLGIKQQVYARHMELYGTEDERTLIEANNYADSLRGLQRFEEAKALMRKTIPVARRVLGENDNLTLMMRCIYASALYRAENATLDDVREAVATLDELARTTRRKFGVAHPLAVTVAEDLQNVQGKRETGRARGCGNRSLAEAG